MCRCFVCFHKANVFSMFPCFYHVLPICHVFYMFSVSTTFHKLPHVSSSSYMFSFMCACFHMTKIEIYLFYMFVFSFHKFSWITPCFIEFLHVFIHVCMFSHDKDKDIPVLHVCFLFSQLFMNYPMFHWVLTCFHSCVHVFTWQR